MEPNKWRSSQSSQGNYVTQTLGYDKFLEMWPLFLESFDSLIAPKGANMTNLTVDELFKTLLHLAVYPENGFLGCLYNKNGGFLGYVAAISTSIAFRPSALQMFAIYSNEKCPSTPKELIYELKEWARKHGFSKLHATMFRKSGTARNFFKFKLGMKENGFNFEVEL
jgi:hypothetical protein